VEKKFGPTPFILLFSPEDNSMRSLALTFFFFVLLFGFGTIVLSSEVSPSQNATDGDFFLGQVSGGTEAATSSIQVDRDDDPQSATPCTSAPNDCSLRSAITIANNDGKPTTITFANNYLIRLAQPLPTLWAEKTTLKAARGQEVHIDGNGFAASVLRITGAHVEVEGLRIYGAGAGYPNLVISEAANNVTIAHNIIGDDDAPFGNCGSSDQSYGGIYVDGVADIAGKTRAWVYGNVIECNNGFPGDGITVRSGGVIIGKDPLNTGDDSQRNIIRNNRGFGVNLMDTTGNTICDNELIANGTGSLYMINFQNNNVMYNDIVEGSSETNLG
jgi:hypothetical protein